VFTTRQLRLRSVVDQAQAWELAARAVGGHASRLLRVKQVHGRTVRVVRDGTSFDAAAADAPEADAIASDVPGMVLAVQVADCVPLLLADPRSGAVAAVHAGWRGMAARVASAAVDTLAREFGARAADLVAAIGPSIGPCCYEVGPDLIDAFRVSGASDRELGRWFVYPASGSLRLDLWTASSDQLVASGVPEPQIHRCGLCTKTHAAIFDSYRADGPAAGRMAALIRVLRA
jgi:YfiH family protein